MTVAPYNQVGRRIEETETKRIFKVIDAFVNIYNQEVLDVIYEDNGEQSRKIVKSITIGGNEVMFSASSLGRYIYNGNIPISFINRYRGVSKDGFPFRQI